MNFGVAGLEGSSAVPLSLSFHPCVDAVALLLYCLPIPFHSLLAIADTVDSSEGVLQWIDDEELLKLDLWEGDRIFIPWLEQPGFFSGKFVYQAGKLVEHRAVFYDQPLESYNREYVERRD